MQVSISISIAIFCCIFLDDSVNLTYMTMVHVRLLQFKHLYNRFLGYCWCLSALSIFDINSKTYCSACVSLNLEVKIYKDDIA